ncbi:MAG: glucose-6-phosphate dehydrogenase [Verrucomicrobiota bacterium]|nr:glucose-6-phosphate dehydrogenase [Verrucomicrobiota bacterium]
MSNKDKKNNSLSITIVGASGDLATQKIFPALFALFSQNLLPENTLFFGFARSTLSDMEFREKITKHLICRYTPEHSCERYMSDFLEKCFYCQGKYNSVDSFLDLYTLMREKNVSRKSNRIFYLAIPPDIFSDVAKAIGDSALVYCRDDVPWSRVIIEKPFGKDRDSSDKLTHEMAKIFTEEQTYRIDHYLGKEVVQNLLVLRFANQIFKPLWNSDYIKKIEIIWSEDKGIEGRGGYFDNYGIIRDIIQNHLLQILAMVTMEEPNSLSAREIRDKKVKVLSKIPPLKIDDILLGQYVSVKNDNIQLLGYTNDPTVPDSSLTPTFAKVKLKINNKRWKGVPFTITAGKAMKEKKTKVKITFRTPENNIFCSLGSCPPPNELIIRIQPNEGIHCNIVNKIPGKKLVFHEQRLDLSYDTAYTDHVIPEAYESLIMDIIDGDKSLFIRKDELQTAWDIFTPILHQIEKEKIKPTPYSFGSTGPKKNINE